jgi:hypothetical protein
MQPDTDIHHTGAMASSQNAALVAVLKSALVDGPMYQQPIKVMNQRRFHTDFARYVLKSEWIN